MRLQLRNGFCHSARVRFARPAGQSRVCVCAGERRNRKVGSSVGQLRLAGQRIELEESRYARASGGHVIICCFFLQRVILASVVISRDDNVAAGGRTDARIACARARPQPKIDTSCASFPAGAQLAAARAKSVARRTCCCVCVCVYLGCAHTNCWVRTSARSFPQFALASR